MAVLAFEGSQAAAALSACFNSTEEITVTQWKLSAAKLLQTVD